MWFRAMTAWSWTLPEGLGVGAVALVAWLLFMLWNIRRMPRRTLWRNAGIWAAVFGLLFIGALWLEGRV